MPTATLVFVGVKLNAEWSDFEGITSLWEVSVISFAFLLFAILLSGINVGCEAQKWRVASVSEESFLNVFKSVLRGKGYSVLLPNIAGDFIARSRDFEKMDRFIVGGALLLCSSFQLFVTLFFGLLAAMLLPSGDIMKDNRVVVFAILGIAGVILFVVLSRSSSKLVSRLSDEKKKWVTLKSYAQSIGYTQLSQLLMFSLLRYIIMGVQYAFVLGMIGLSPSVEFFTALAIFFLLKSIVPSVNALFEFSFRSISSVAIFGMLTSLSVLEVLFISNFIWVINGLVPALSGVVLTFLKKKN